MNSLIRTGMTAFTACIGGVIGWIAGACLAGNYSTQFKYLGLLGYEAGACLGAQVGFLTVGALTLTLFELRKKRLS